MRHVALPFDVLVCLSVGDGNMSDIYLEKVDFGQLFRVFVLGRVLVHGVNLQTFCFGKWIVCRWVPFALVGGCLLKMFHP